MPDKGTARETESKFKPHPAGPFVAQCVDFLNFGECVTDYPGSPKELVPKIGYVFRTGKKQANGETCDVFAEFSNFFSPKAKLRLFLESWRGKAYTQEQVKAGVDLAAVVGKWCLLNIGHKTSAAGRTYAVVLSISQVPHGMTMPPAFDTYTRPEFLEKKKAKYAEDAATFRAEIGVDEHGNPIGSERVTFDESGGVGLPDLNDDDSSLPF